MNTMPSNLSISTEIIKNLGILADDGDMLARVAKYLRRLVKDKENSLAVSQGEYLAKIERGEEEYRLRKSGRIETLEELNLLLNSL